MSIKNLSEVFEGIQFVIDQSESEIALIRNRVNRLSKREFDKQVDDNRSLESMYLEDISNTLGRLAALLNRFGADIYEGK